MSILDAPGLRDSKPWAAAVLASRTSTNAIYIAQNPQAVYDPTTRRTFLAYNGPARDFYVTYYDHATKQVGASTKIAGATITRDDDHSAPTIFVDKFGYICIICGNHGGQFLFAKSTSPGDPSAFNVRTMSEVPGGTYQSTCYDAATHTIWVGYRTGSAHGATYPTHEFGTLVRSTDGGTTFTDLGPSIDTTGWSADAAKDAYVMDLDLDTQGRPHVTFFVAAGLGHDGRRVNLYHAYFSPTDGHWHAMSGTDLGTKITNFAACLVANVDQCGAPKHILLPDGTVLIGYGQPAASGTVINTTLSAATIAGAVTMQTAALIQQGAKLVVGTGGTQETVWAIGSSTGTAPTTVTVGDGVNAGLINAHASGEAVVATPQNIGHYVARWNGSTWTVVDTGRRTNHLYVSPGIFWRDPTTGVVDNYGVEGHLERQTVLRPGTGEPAVFAGAGGDVCRYTSADGGATWVRGAVVLSGKAVIGNGVMNLGVIGNASPEMKFLAQGGTVNGPSSWRIPIYGVSDRLGDGRAVGGAAISPPGLVMRPGSRPFISGTVPPTGSWFTMDLALIAPSDATEVQLRLIAVCDGTAGLVTWTAREYLSTRSLDIEQQFNRGVTANQIAYVWVPLSPELRFDYQQTGGITGLTVQGVAFRL